MAIKWDKINWDLRKRLKNLARSSFDNGDYLGAFMLQMLFLETALSLAMWNLLNKKIQDSNLQMKYVSKYVEGYQTFNSLIDYFFLLALDHELYEKLRALNKNRNQIIHNIFEFTSFDQVLQESRNLYLEAEKLETILLDKYIPEGRETKNE